MAKIADLFCSEERWTKGPQACDALGNPVDARSSAAVRFCLFGAVRHCYGLHEEDAVFAKLALAMGFDGQRYEGRLYAAVIHFNERPTTTFADVRRLVEEAGV